MKKILAGLVLLILANIAYSQEEDKLLIAEIKQSTVVTQPATLNKGFFLLGSTFTYATNDKIFSTNGKKEYEIGNGCARYSTEYLHFQYGLTNRIELAFALPYKILSLSYSTITEIPLIDTSLMTKVKLQGKGLGDIEFGIYYQIIKGSKTKPSLVSKLSATFTTGEKNPTNIKSRMEYDMPTGSGEPTISLELIYRKITFPYSYSFYGLFKYSFGGEKVMIPYENSVSFKSGNYYNAGGNFNFLLNDWIALQNDLYFFYQRNNRFYGETGHTEMTQYALFYSPNISFQFKKFRLVQGVLFPFIGKTTTADPQFNIDLQYIF